MDVPSSLSRSLAHPPCAHKLYRRSAGSPRLWEVGSKLHSMRGCLEGLGPGGDVVLAVAASHALLGDFDGGVGVGGVGCVGGLWRLVEPREERRGKARGLAVRRGGPRAYGLLAEHLRLV